MQGMLLGLGDMIGSAFASVLGGLIEIILTPLMDKVVVPIINMILNLAMEILGGFFYLLGVFVLALVDFTEMLFRILAGLGPISDGRPYATLSLDGRSGDILIQLIRNPAIQEAFLSMCIVGLFLLVITTVFQIIKVEYTTEGAKNAKGPIFQKAFKGLANLMLLPLLVVFGVFLANQVLGLLDTATRGEGDNPTISGQIFATSASQAFYMEDDRVFYYKEWSMQEIVKVSLSSLVHVLFDAIGDAWTEDDEEYLKSEDERADILEKFVQQEEGYRYYEAWNVSQYFALSKINYIVLIFGGFTVLKCLFFTCFGMILRLYKCAVLFIIAPVVIGMTPINEGGLGKWRTSFIGQVLSAYGTVIALNLFFIIVRVLLNIKLKFEGIEGFALTAEFMTGLLKAIMVIAGVLLIEKFSKEIGGYFGADDAMSAGKDLAKQIGDTAMKGGKVAAGVASGGMKVAKGVAGVAGSFIPGVGGIAAKGLSAGAAGLAGIVGKGAAAGSLRANAASGLIKYSAKKKVQSDALFKKFDNDTVLGKAYNQFRDEKAGFKAQGKINRNTRKLKKNEKKDNKAWNRLFAIDEELRGDNLTEERKNSLLEEQSQLEKGITDREVQAKDLNGENAGLANTTKPWTERKKKIADSALRGKSLFTGLAEEGKSILNPTHKFFGDMDKAMKRGAEINGDAYVTAYENKGAQKKKDQQDEASSGVWGKIIEASNKGGFDIATERMIDTFKHEQEKTRTALERALNNVSGGRWKDLTDTQRDSRLQSITSQAQAMGSSLSERQIEQLLSDKNGNVTLGDLKITMDAKEVENQIKTIMSSGKTLEQKIDELKSLADKEGKAGREATVAGIIKAIEELKSQLGGK